MVNNKQKGFTLIELLVVIAIIGILASVVLASLNTARAKGADASIKSNMANIRAQAELWYDNNGQTYGSGTTCSSGAFADTVITSAIAQIDAQNGGAAGNVTCNIDTTGQAWAISSPLKSSGTWCVDNTGSAGSGVASGGNCS